jgi:hypothetical protein
MTNKDDFLSTNTNMDFTSVFIKEKYDHLFELTVWDSREQIILAVAYPMAFFCNGYDIASHLQSITGYRFDVNEHEEITLNDKAVMQFDEHLSNFKYIQQLLQNFCTLPLCRLFHIKHLYPSKPVDLSANDLY